MIEDLVTEASSLGDKNK
nr:hypothetical protein [Tanacetum cinerariifolium]